MRYYKDFMLRKLLVAMGVLLAFCAVSLVAARLVIAYAARTRPTLMCQRFRTGA